ncbi:hypothetical protein [Ornithinimicrobium sp. INDO-MA30-4]|uniref:hypothetical protein n=1 Tax=Ornithinimicrobium sp. INDO-MA30-4 TaxID=2908651 RepID=UPI0028832DB5|nr:hypothetical protein [Ornithinimicrobium sp. INDO-MA30-4]
MISQLAELRANVLEVQHGRTTTSLRVSEVLIALTVETEGQEHSARVQQSLINRGYHRERKPGAS